ncbi:ABC transporter permease [Belnapia sp. T6]|uniref:ABC transporter permease n=1 Tax=Belnapia mucosa TaxID=2804532 RepID=A0ABS1UZK9_9PROT|nr:ABC transporter permease [Belnapia mucosa]MBL6454266.1 ABC transporter permease [Belnapia mucosa]
MIRFILRRLAQAVPLLVGVSLIGFGLMHLAPGGPLAIYTLNPSIQVQDIERIKAVFGLDQPVPVQYLKWATGLATGDWGTTFFGGRPVLATILERLPATLLLMGSALAIAILLGLGIGLLGAVRRYSVFDALATSGALFALSFPTFWFGLMAIWIFAIELRWLPSGGMYELGEEGDPLSLLRHLVLPVMVLALVITATWSRYARSAFLEVLGQDFMRTARAKGMPLRARLLRHALPNAAKPLIALLGVELPFLFSGALVTETIFGWPGMGRLFVDALGMKEYPVLMGLMMFTALFVIAGNLIADIAIAAVDPRVRL